MEVLAVGIVLGLWLFRYAHRAARKAGRRIERRARRQRCVKTDSIRLNSATHLEPILSQRATPAPFDASTAAPPPEKPVLTGPARIIDGDSLVIQKTQIRLFGVDAPEMNHPFGIQAKWALIKLCKGHSIQAKVLAIDAHGRTVALCTLPDGRDLSAEMVKAGLAIDWAKFSRGIYRDLETPDARRKLWLADARQKGRMDVWEQFEAKQATNQRQDQT